MRRQLLLLALLCFSFSSIAAEQLDQISVNGKGSVSVAPDLLDLRFSLSATEKTVVESKRVVDQQYSQILNLMTQFQVADTDINAGQIRSNPVYEWQRELKIFKGFRVSRQIHIVVRDFAKYPALLQALVDANVTTIDGVTARLSDPTSAQEQALIAAMQAAQSKAKLMAEQFGRELGAVLQIVEAGAPSVGPIHKRSVASAALQRVESDTLPVEQFGLQKINALVHIVFRLE